VADVLDIPLIQFLGTVVELLLYGRCFVSPACFDRSRELYRCLRRSVRRYRLGAASAEARTGCSYSEPYHRRLFVVHFHHAHYCESLALET
jgi:hypothetical protein